MKIPVFTNFSNFFLGLSVTECWEEIAKSSSLAKAISHLYDAISRSEIAKFTLNHKLHSLQIPIITQVDSLPTVSQKVFSGTELSTLPPFNALYDDRNPKIQNLALLLLDDPYNIIRDFRLNEDSLLATLLHKILPTESIAKLSNRMNAATSYLTDLAAHLIYWRKARAIFPISRRNTYIVSPLAPLAQLYNLSVLFRNAFPTLPSLSSILSEISANEPQQFKYTFPVDKKDAEKKKVYHEALAWLIKYGFLSLIQTFVLIKISKSIKTLVKNEIQQTEPQRESVKDLGLVLEKQSAILMKTQESVSLAEPQDKDVPRDSISMHRPSSIHESASSSGAISIPNTATTTINLRKGGLGGNEIYFKVHVNPRKIDSSLSLPSPLGQYPALTENINLKGESHSVESRSLEDNAPILKQFSPGTTSLSKINVAGTPAAHTNAGTWGGNRLNSVPHSGVQKEGLERSSTYLSASVPSTSFIKSGSCVTGTMKAQRSYQSFTARTLNPPSGGIGGLRRSKISTDLSENPIEEDNTGVSEEWTEDTIIHEPQSATALQMKWIEKLLEDKLPNIVINFRKIMKYMDGHTPMEWTLQQENISQKEFYEVINSLGDNLIVVRHW